MLLMDLGALNMISRVYSPSPMPSPLPSSLPDIPTRVLKLWCSACGWSVRKARSNMAAQVDTVVPKKNKTVHTTARAFRKPTRQAWGFVAWEFGGFGDPNKNPWIWPHRFDGSKWHVTMHGKKNVFLWRWKYVVPRFSKWGIFNGLFGGD